MLAHACIRLPTLEYLRDNWRIRLHDDVAQTSKPLYYSPIAVRAKAVLDQPEILYRNLPSCSQTA
ncbi:hypothetical protein AnigIFM56816_011655, partial [Aspergillus niger]